MNDDQHRPDSIQRRATLHEKAVQKAAEAAQPPRRPRGPAASRSGPVVQVRPPLDQMGLDPRILRELQRQHVPPLNVQVLAPDDVVVWNHPAPWPDITTHLDPGGHHD